MGLLDDDSLHLPNFDWDKAKMFYYVVKCGNISEATQFLNITQPSISRHIKILEAQLNCSLLTRNNSGVKLTRKGEEFFALIEEAFLKLKGFSYNQAVMSSDGQKRKIKISTTHAIAAYIINPLLINFHKLYPHISFEVITDNHLIDLILNDVDISIRPYINSTKGLQQEYLFSLKKKLYASREYINRKGPLLHIEDLNQHDVIAPAEPESYPYSDVLWILRVGMPEGKLREPVYTSNSLECLVEAAKNGLGIIGSYNEMSLIRESGLEKLLNDFEGPSVEEYIMYSDYLQQDKMFQNLKNFLITNLSAYRDKKN